MKSSPLVLVSMLSSLVLTSCSMAPIRVHFSQVPEIQSLPFDGVWLSPKGVRYKLQKGRLYTMDPSPSLPRGSVIAVDIRQKEDPFDIPCRVYNTKQVTGGTGFGPGSIQITSVGTIDLLYHPCPKLGLKRFVKETLRIVEHDVDLGLPRLFLFSQKIPGAENSKKYEIALRDKALEAIPYGTDPLLTEVVDKCSSKKIRLKALGKISDVGILVDYAIRGESLDLRLAALGHCPDGRLSKIIMESKDEGVWKAALAKCPAEQSIKVLKKTGNGKIRDYILGRLKGPKALSAVVLMDLSPAIKRRCLAKITDPTYRAKIAGSTRDLFIAKRVIEGMTDPSLLEFIAKKSKSETIRTMAKEMYSVFTDISKLLPLGDKALEQGHRGHELTLRTGQSGLSTHGVIRDELSSYAKAIDYFKLALTLEPRSPIATAKLALAGTCHARQGNTAMVLNNRGLKGVYSKVDPSWLKLADKGSALAPKDPMIHALRGWTYTVAYRVRRQAAEMLEESLDSPELTGLLDTAIESLTLAIDGNKGLPRSLCNRAVCLYYKQQYSRAGADVRAAIKHGGEPQPKTWIIVELAGRLKKK